LKELKAGLGQGITSFYVVHGT